MSCILFGHSYVRRIRQEYGPPGCYGDVSTMEDGYLFADSLKLREVLGDGIFTYAATMITDIPVAYRPDCDLLVIDLGSNDLALLKHSCRRVMFSLAKFLFDWAIRSPAKHIILLGVLPRSGRLRGSIDTFRSNRDFYHAALSTLCSSNERTSFCKLRGFENRDHVNPKPISDWSRDGIHPKDMSHYVNRLRMLIMQIYRVKISRS